MSKLKAAAVKGEPERRGAVRIRRQARKQRRAIAFLCSVPSKVRGRLQRARRCCSLFLMTAWAIFFL